ncbi:MAG: FAD-binding protein [Candidatus Melainabacteria bacterium]|nr:FAD-binding protein [Candidatus Melainabacteria bacterium]
MTNRNNRFNNEPVIVIGSGIAGLLLSIELAESGCKVKLVTKGRVDQSNTAWAQGGLAAVTGMNEADSKEQHLADTLAAGDGLTDPVVASRITADGAKLVHRMARHGVAFDPSSLAREGGHRMARVLHCADATGRAIVDALIITARRNPNIEIIENYFLKEILTEDSHVSAFRNSVPRALGIIAIMGGVDTENGAKSEGAQANLRADSNQSLKPEERASAREITIRGRAVVLATGGLGQVYARTTNPTTATGDGIAAAYRAGAHLADMEFVQFHPTALHLPGAPAFLITEAARGAGAVLLDKNGDRFAHLYHSAGELATRDIVSRAIHLCMKADDTESVWLDMRRLGETTLMERFPTIVEKVRTFGIDPVKEFVPVSPAAHYFMGGVLADEFGRTTVQNLFAIGECASTGLHGANRLASNSLLEGGVMALNLAELLSTVDTADNSSLCLDRLSGTHTGPGHGLMKLVDPAFAPADFDREIFRKRMLGKVGLVRTEQGLDDLVRGGLSTIHQKNAPVSQLSNARTVSSAIPLQERDAELNSNTSVPSFNSSDIEKNESHSLYIVGMLIAQSALLRRESRGAHWRQDYPNASQQSSLLSRLVVHKSGVQWLPMGDSASTPNHPTVSTILPAR